MIYSFHFTVDHKRRYALVAQASNRAHLLDMDTFNPSTVGRNLQDFTLQDQNYPGKPTNAFGAVFANGGESVIFGSMGEKTLIWDKRSGKVTHELDHGDGESLLSVTSKIVFADISSNTRYYCPSVSGS